MQDVQTALVKLEGLSADAARSLVLGLTPEVAAPTLEALGCSRVLELVAEADDATKDAVLSRLPEVLRSRWLDNAKFSPRTVGRFVDPTAARFRESVSVGDATAQLRRLVKDEFVTYLFIVDEAQRLKGIVAMRELLLAATDTALGVLMIRNPFSLAPEMILEDAMRLVVKKHFPVYPVVNQEGVFIGVVRGSRLFEAQAIEISAQPGAMVGVEKEERLSTMWPRSFKLRHPWLQLNLLTAFLAGGVVSVFQGTIDQLVILAAFLPVLAGQSGNTGCQALAVTIRGVTLGDYKSGGCAKLVRKEAMLGLMNGFFVGLIAGGGMYVMASMQGSPNAIVLSLVVLCAMVGSCMISGVSGVVVPLTLKRFGFDPATASSIFLTTATDVASMGMLLGLATIFVL